MTIKNKSKIIISMFLIILLINSIGTYFNTSEIKNTSKLLNFEIDITSNLLEVKYLLKELQEVSTNIALIGEKDRLEILEKSKSKYEKLIKSLSNKNISQKDKKLLTNINTSFQNYYKTLYTLAILGIEKTETSNKSKEVNEKFNQSIVVAESSLRSIRKELPRLERTKLKLLIVTTKEVLTNALVVATQKEVDDSATMQQATLNYISVLSKKFPEASIKLEKLKVEYINFYKDGVELATQGVIIENKIKSINEIMHEANEIAFKIQSYIEKIVLEKQKELNQTIQNNNSSISTLQLTTIAYGLVFMFGILLLFILLKQTVGTITIFKDELISFFRYLNNESEDVKLLKDTTKDEFADMAKVVNSNIIKTKKGLEEDRQLVNETIKVLKEYEKGDFSLRINSNVSNNVLMELKDVLNKLGTNMENNVTNVLDILNEFSKFDYTKKIDTKGLKNHLEILANGVNNLGETISSMLLTSLENGYKLELNSKVLLENVNALNESSNESAASIEETAAAIEEINSTVTNNAEKVVKMSNYADKLSQEVEEGEKLATKTTQSMDEINNQVTSINEAIVLIDQIAFQTNILSLNAAVEAATAGEAGKGFAVVAQEVRNLASRSAEVATEIKSLVETATLKASEGKSISDIMIKGYSSLHTNIQSTIDLINDVSISSKEQQQGIGQISIAINSLDEQTQKNAQASLNASEIANTTSQIASEILKDANSKEFIGKN